MRRVTLRVTLLTRLALSCVLVGAGAAALVLVLMHFNVPPFAAFGLALVCVVPAAWLAMRAQLRPVLSLFRALEGTVTSYRDGDFSFGLSWQRNDELSDLVEAHNALGGVLREQRLGLVQRELLLDTMVQNTPVAMLLVGDGGAIVYANVAARQLLGNGRKLEGHHLEDILDKASPELLEAVAREGDGLFTVGEADLEEVYHLARRSFTLNGRKHELFLLRQLTLELRRQEVQTWKKVIRVISHELNNSLAPLASLARSGTELVKRGQTERLPQILETIGERTRHLESFILGYARFAKLPAPRKVQVTWSDFLERLASQMAFRLVSEPLDHATFDPAQMEQALINLLKNAHESGSPPEGVELGLRQAGGFLRIDVHDRGSGMSDAVLTQALVPFYSTKRHGTGLGLALAREIAEAHGGRITLANREGGGLTVSLILPAP